MGDTGKWIGTLNAMERKTRTGSRRTPGLNTWHLVRRKHRRASTLRVPPHCATWLLSCGLRKLTCGCEFQTGLSSVHQNRNELVAHIRYHRINNCARCPLLQ